MPDAAQIYAVQQALVEQKLGRREAKEVAVYSLCASATRWQQSIFYGEK